MVDLRRGAALLITSRHRTIRKWVSQMVELWRGVTATWKGHLRHFALLHVTPADINRHPRHRVQIRGVFGDQIRGVIGDQIRGVLGDQIRGVLGDVRNCSNVTFLRKSHEFMNSWRRNVALGHTINSILRSDFLLRHSCTALKEKKT
jgi:hypothetical protein